MDIVQGDLNNIWFLASIECILFGGWNRRGFSKLKNWKFTGK